MTYLDELFGLAGRTAVVTGGTSGLGAASAVALARAGAKVIVGGRDRESGENVLAEIESAGPDAQLKLPCPAKAEQAVACAHPFLARHDPVDILVNAAGVFAHGDAADAK